MEKIKPFHISGEALQELANNNPDGISTIGLSGWLGVGKLRSRYKVVPSVLVLATLDFIEEAQEYAEVAHEHFLGGEW